MRIFLDERPEASGAGCNRSISATGLLDGIHGGVGSFEQAVGGVGVFRVEGDADAGRSPHHVPAHSEGLVEAVLEAVRNLLNVGAIAHSGHDHSELVAAQARQSVAEPQLMLSCAGPLPADTCRQPGGRIGH